MTSQIGLVLAILVLAVVLFVHGRLRMDVVALLVLATLALTGLVTPTEALSGFSNPAVITVWAVFILSGSLSRTGVASLIGRQVLRMAGQGEAGLLLMIMLTAGFMSAFMNNVGVAALLLPVVMDIARNTGMPPSKLLMPLAYSSLLGGLTTLIGTPPNILVSNALRDYGLQPFQLFDYTPIGLTVMLAGIAFLALIGRHLLPVRDLSRESSSANVKDLRQFYNLQERLFVVRLPVDSALASRTLGESRLGSALGLNVIAIMRGSQTQPAPNPDVVLRAGDRLLVQGRPERLLELQSQQQLLVDTASLSVERLGSAESEIAEVGLATNSPLLGKTLSHIDFRRRFEVNVLAIRHQGALIRKGLAHIPLAAGDTLLIQGPRIRIDALRETPDFLVSRAEQAEVYRLHERLIVVHVPEGSILVGKTLSESRLGDAFGLTVLSIVREDTTSLAPNPAERLMAGDTLLVQGQAEDLLTLRGLQGLEIDSEGPTDLGKLESEQIGLVEAVLAPRTTLAGQTLRQIHFREKYGLSVLAIWREGQAYRSNLRDMALKFGDALLLYGPREQLKVLGSDPDFLVLTREAQEAPQLAKAPVAVLVIGMVLLPVLLGWLPIYIAAVVGATLMILTGCLTMEEAYRSIEWQAVFLIAGMLPLGIAMEQTGAARFLAEGVISTVGGLGPIAVIASLFIMTSLATQIIPTAALVVLMAPIAFNTAANLTLSPHALMMTVAMAASASFMSPVSHPANVLVMGPGGYRFTDYTKLGLPLTLLVFAVVLVVLPILWPLSPP